jgi:hypothetical protein
MVGRRALLDPFPTRQHPLLCRTDKHKEAVTGFKKVLEMDQNGSFMDVGGRHKSPTVIEAYFGLAASYIAVRADSPLCGCRFADIKRSWCLCVCS